MGDDRKSAAQGGFGSRLGVDGRGFWHWWRDQIECDRNSSDRAVNGGLLYAYSPWHESRHACCRPAARIVHRYASLTKILLAWAVIYTYTAGTGSSLLL